MKKKEKEELELFVQLSDGRISIEDATNIKKTFNKYGLDFNVGGDMDNIYKTLYGNQGDYKEWEDSDLTFDFMVEQLNETLNSAMDNGLIEINEEDFDELSNVQQIITDSFGWR